MIPVVGIGASAGGLQAASRFLDAMPADSGCAFVIILHLDPTRESALAHLLGGHTAMPVVEAADGMVAEPNRVHAIVPDRALTIRDGALRLSVPAEARGHRHPIDVFFETLAEDCQERAIGIVLSGTGNDGTHGLREIKARGAASAMLSARRPARGSVLHSCVPGDADGLAPSGVECTICQASMLRRLPACCRWRMIRARPACRSSAGVTYLETSHNGPLVV